MTQDTVSPRDIARSVPSILKRFPSIARGLYYYAASNANKPLTLGSLIERNAKNVGHRSAILYEDRSITWRELDHWANRIAQYLTNEGLRKGDAIAILLENRPELLAVVAGAAKIGVACAMLNTSQKGRVLSHSVALVDPKMVVVGEELTDVFDEIKHEVKSTHPRPFQFLADANTLNVFGDAPDGYSNLATSISRQSSVAPNPSSEITMGDTAVYLFTSGTTGLPKAAPGSHRKFIKAYGGFGLMSLAMEPEDVLYCTLPLYHGTALLVCWGSVLAGGSALALRRKFSAREFWKDVDYYKATTFGYVGELCRYLLNQPKSDKDAHNTLTKMIGNGLRPSIWGEFKDRFGIDTVAELYASSEGNIGFSNFFNMDRTVGFTTAPYKLVQFHDGTRDPVRDGAGFMKEVEKGEPGLLIGEITEKWSFEGYTQKEATEKSILRDAFKKGDQWFNTGDVLKNIGCGHLQFVDRMGDTFRWKGENVSTTELENIIDGSGLVEEAIVYGVEIPGTNGKAGMVTLVPLAGKKEFNPDQLLSYLMDNLPAYAIPVFIRVTDAIEKTGTFKYRKVDIQKLGYSVDNEKEAVYALLPREKHYSRVTPELKQRIDSGDLNF